MPLLGGPLFWLAARSAPGTDDLVVTAAGELRARRFVRIREIGFHRAVEAPAASPSPSSAPSSWPRTAASAVADRQYLEAREDVAVATVGAFFDAFIAKRRTTGCAGSRCTTSRRAARSDRASGPRSRSDQ